MSRISLITLCILSCKIRIRDRPRRGGLAVTCAYLGTHLYIFPFFTYLLTHATFVLFITYFQLILTRDTWLISYPLIVAYCALIRLIRAYSRLFSLFSIK